MSIKVCRDDVLIMRSTIKDAVIKKFPEIEQAKITDRQLFNILVKHGLGVL